jgi:hypothetical protein
MSVKRFIVFLLLVAAPWHAAPEAPPPTLNQSPNYVDSYYGDYRVTGKQAGLPAKSLQGPRREAWIPPRPSIRGYRIGVLFPHLKDLYRHAMNYGIVAEAKRQKGCAPGCAPIGESRGFAPTWR